MPEGPARLGGEASVLGEGPTVEWMRVTNARGAGIERNPHHHVFPQEEREWFAQRGVDVDDFTIELERATHEAIHGGGDWKLGRQAWDEEWNRDIMNRLVRAEKRTLSEHGRMLTREEIVHIGLGRLKAKNLPADVVRYPRAAGISGADMVKETSTAAHPSTPGGT